MSPSLVKIVCLSKFYSRWNDHLRTRFLLAGYDIDFIYMDEVCGQVGLNFLANKQFLEGLIKRVNHIKPKFILYDLEFVPQLFPHEIARIVKETKTLSVGLALDDDLLHEANKYLYSSVDKILSNSPLSEENYKAYGRSAMCILPFELPPQDINPETDIYLKKNHVLIYGDLKKADRLKKIKVLIQSEIPVHILEQGVSYAEIYSQINQAKIVLNFSKSDSVEKNLLSYCPRSFLNKVLKKGGRFNYQAKGRIFEVAYLNSVCVSEYFPLHEKLLSNKAMPIFFCDEEMVATIKMLFKNDESLATIVKAMRMEMVSQYSTEKISLELKTFLESIAPQESSQMQLPFTLAMAVIVNKASYLRNPLVCIECGLRHMIRAPLTFFNALLLTICSLIILASNALVYGVQRLKNYKC